MVIRRPPALVVVAGAVTCVGLMIGTGALPGHWLDSARSPGVCWLAVACAAVALAELGRLRIRVGETWAELAWSETAFIIICVVLPAGWVPAAVVVGALSTHTLLGVLDQRRTVTLILNSVALLAVGSTVGLIVTRGLARTYDQPATAWTTVALVAGALVYAVTTLYLNVLQLVGQWGDAARTLFTRLFASKLPMLIGNIAVGLLIVTVRGTGRGWLVVLLPPVGWLLHQAYGHALRADDERRTWQLFSEVTAQLNRLEEQDTAMAGVTGALRLFPAKAVEVVVLGQGPGQTRTYTGSRDGETGEATENLVDNPATVGWKWALPVEPRPLVVRGTPIGEIRLRFARPMHFSRRDRHMLAAYGDALAAALHDAVTHRQLRTMTERSTYDAVHDPLTGVVNRAELLARGSAILRDAPERTAVVLMVLDINHFKEVNNTLGHAAGDELLHAVAMRLGASMRANELLARLGGDEFAVLATWDQHDPLGMAIERAETLAGQVSAPTEVGGVVLSVEASVGVVSATTVDVNMTELLRRADIAMYQAKRGMTQVAFYESIKDETSVDRLALLAEVREALAAKDQLTLVVQPAVALDTGLPVGAEVLVRWDHPRRGRLRPADFLDAVEHSELIGAFTRYVLDQALEIAGQWARAGIEMPIAVNLAARSLLDPTLAHDLPKLLERHGVRPERLTLEITESVVLTELAVVEEVLAALRAVGVRIAVDDFGSGFSSLTFLSRVPVDEVKIDRVFISRMIDSAEAEAIVRTAVDLGRQLGLRVVAEGVETDAQRNALHVLGCTTAQGFHFYRPLSPERATTVLMGANQLSV